MFDINFFMKSYQLKKDLLNGKKVDRETLNHTLNSYLSKDPTIFSIEPTNRCNMQCSFCPRSKMTRKIETMNLDLFKTIIDQIKPWTLEEWEKWTSFIKKEYNIQENEASENNFYLYIIPKVITLHSYGESLLDKDLNLKIDYMTSKGFESYFSCNPSNIKHDKVINLFKSGLNYIKFSIDSVSSPIRGKKDIFKNYYPKIMKLIDEKQKNNYNTKIVITMIDLGLENQQEQWGILQEHFKGTNSYIYLKSRDQVYHEQRENRNISICWNEPCLFPWHALNVHSNGEVVLCSEDYNDNLIIGNIKKQSLIKIWHGDKIKKMRESHINNSCSYCQGNCDMKQIGYYIND